MPAPWVAIYFRRKLKVMADNIVVRRGIKLYIDNVEIENSIKSIKAQMKLLTNEQSKMTVGSDDYVKHGRKISELDAMYQ